MKNKKITFKTGGRNSVQTLTNAMKLLKYIDELDMNKMYGIMKCGKGIMLLTKQEVICKSKFSSLINDLERDGFVGYADEIRDILEEL